MMASSTGWRRSRVARQLSRRSRSRRAAAALRARGPVARRCRSARGTGRTRSTASIQDVGTGTDFPDPDADPFCVEFDKTNQNVTDFGIVDFTAQEPARVAAAGNKCFYFQRDHWTGSIVQGSDPELWHWDGNYFFDRARGVGGAHLTNFRVGGMPQDATPYVPAPTGPTSSRPEAAGSRSCSSPTRTRPAARKSTRRRSAPRSTASEPRYKRCIEPGGQLRGRADRPGPARHAPRARCASGSGRRATTRASRNAGVVIGGWT